MRALIIGSLASVVACGGDASGPPTPAPACTPAQAEALVVQVGAGLEPVFTWKPRCSISEIRVDYIDPFLLGSPPVVTWRHIGPAVTPPIRYATPDEILPDLHPPDSLRAGRLYVVRLYQGPDTLGKNVEVAFETFVP